MVFTPRHITDCLSISGTLIGHAFARMPAHFRLVAVRAAVLIWLAGTDNFYPGALSWTDCQAEAMQLHDRGLLGNRAVPSLGQASHQMRLGRP